MGSLLRILPEMKAYKGSDVGPRLEIITSTKDQR